MITDTIINILLFLPLVLLAQIENVDVNLALPDNVYNAFKDLVAYVDYILPMNVFIMCISFKILIRFWNLPYALLLRIKSFIPTMGD